MTKVSNIAALEQRALELTKANVQRGRSSRAGSYLAKFVDILAGVDEETALTRVEIIAKISVGICSEAFEADGGLNFDNPEHLEEFAKVNKKVKAQVAAAISDSQNNTSLSFNPSTKDKYELNRASTGSGEVYWITEK
jgi:hypothetical protein